MVENETAGPPRADPVLLHQLNLGGQFQVCPSGIVFPGVVEILKTTGPVRGDFQSAPEAAAASTVRWARPGHVWVSSDRFFCDDQPSGRKFREKAVVAGRNIGCRSQTPRTSQSTSPGFHWPRMCGMLRGQFLGWPRIAIAAFFRWIKGSPALGLKTFGPVAILCAHDIAHVIVGTCPVNVSEDRGTFQIYWGCFGIAYVGKPFLFPGGLRVSRFRAGEVRELLAALI